MVLCCEFLVDWIKHAFITRFNEIPSEVNLHSKIYPPLSPFATITNVCIVAGVPGLHCELGIRFSSKQAEERE